MNGASLNRNEEAENGQPSNRIFGALLGAIGAIVPGSGQGVDRGISEGMDSIFATIGKAIVDEKNNVKIPKGFH